MYIRLQSSTIGDNALTFVSSSDETKQHSQLFWFFVTSYLYIRSERNSTG